jgi:apolipoprotein N-acyltransferase
MRLRVILAAVLSAALLWLASPAVGAGWVAWFALVPIAFVVLDSPPGPYRRLTVPLAYALYLELLLVPALPFGLTDGAWGDPVLPVMVGGSPVLAVALVAIPLFGALLYLIRFGEPWGAEQLRGRLGAIVAVLVPALAWTALDLLRTKFEPGGFWGPLFLSQADSPAGGVAALAGPWALTLAIVATNYALALALVRRSALPALAGAATLGVAMLAGGLALDPTSGPSLRVAAVQPGYDTAEQDRPLLRDFEAHRWERAALDLAGDMAPLTREAAREGARLVVWPEATMYLNPAEEAEVLAYLRRLAASAEVALAIPYFLPDPDRSEMVVLTPDGGLSEPRAKQRPMWYLGESGGSGGPTPLDAAGIRLGTMLGIETGDPRIAGRLAAEGASLLVAATHDWGALARQQRAFSRIAAIGSSRALVRADWRYGSAIFAPDGELVADAGEGLRRTVLVADVPLRESATAYSQIGDVAGWLALILAAGAWLGARALRLSRGGAPSSGGRAPRRAPTPPPRSPGRPRAGAVRSRPLP